MNKAEIVILLAGVWSCSFAAFRIHAALHQILETLREGNRQRAAMSRRDQP
jgi:hypothetical protein